MKYRIDELLECGPIATRRTADEFFLGVYMTAAGPGELLTKISVPPGKSDGFASVPIGKDGTCIVNVAASLTNGTARLAIGCVAAVPVLLTPDSTEDAAVRNTVHDAKLDPPWDVHASAEYRRHLAEVGRLRVAGRKRLGRRVWGMGIVVVDPEEPA